MKMRLYWIAATFVAGFVVSASAADPREIYWWGAELPSEGWIQWAGANNWKDADGNLTNAKDGDIAIFDSTRWNKITSYVGMNGTSAYQLIFRGNIGPNLSGYKTFPTPNGGIRIEGPFGVSSSTWLGVGTQTFPIYLQESTSSFSQGSYLSGSAKVVKTGAGNLTFSNTCAGNKFTGSIDFSGGGTLTANDASAFGIKGCAIHGTEDAPSTLKMSAGYTLAASILWEGPADPASPSVIFSGTGTYTLGSFTLTNGTVAAGLRLEPAASQTVVVTNLILQGEVEHIIRVGGVGSVTFSNIEIPIGGSIRIPEGCAICAQRVVYGGSVCEMSSGILYSGPEGEGTIKYDWIHGKGTFMLGHPEESSATTVTPVTWTGAKNTNLRDGENWSSTPDFDTFKINAIFATGGSLATEIAENNGKPLSLYKFTGNGTRDFQIGGAGFLYLGAGGVETTSGTETHTYRIDRPIYLRAAQTWVMGASNTLALAGRIRSISSDGTFALQGGGAYELLAANDFQHALKVAASPVHVRADHALGRGTVAVNDNGRLWFHGVTVSNEMTFTSQNTIYGEAHTENIFEGAVKAPNSLTIASDGDPSTFVFRKGLTLNAGNLNIGNQTVVIENVPYYSPDRTYSSAKGVLDLRVASNKLGCNIALLAAGTKIYCRVPYALVALNDFHGGGGIRGDSNGSSFLGLLDISGGDQALRGFVAGSGCVVTSSTAAVFHHVTTPLFNISQHATGIIDCGASFAGLAGFAIEGTATNYTLSATSPTEGELIFDPTKDAAWLKITGSWPNASQVTVKKGTLKLVKSDSLGLKTTLALAGGTVELAAGTTSRVKSLLINGVSLTGGAYGGPDCTEPGVVRPTYTEGGTDYVFSGTGVLKVIKGGFVIHYRSGK